jgi:hypothetical protein
MEQGTLRAGLTAILLAQGFSAAADGDVARVIVKFRTGTALTSAAPLSRPIDGGPGAGSRRPAGTDDERRDDHLRPRPGRGRHRPDVG